MCLTQHYWRFIRKFLYHISSQGNIQGYFIERFWYYLFTGESYNTLDDCFKELFMDIEPIIKIYCNGRKQVWFKNILRCDRIIQRSTSYIIYTKNGIQKILPGVDYIGGDLTMKQCSTIEEALTLSYD